jgi:hypothetical protein
VAWGYHDAYRRLKPSRRICRAVLCSDDGVSVVDWVEGPPGGVFELSLPLGPETTWHDGVIRARNGVTLIAQLPGEARLIRGDGEAPRGYWSPTYGSLTKAQLIIASGIVEGPVVWQLSRTGQHTLRIDGDAIVTGDGTRGYVQWTRPRPQLHFESRP